ncbi:hypothetical protein KCP69_03415 [Salmonella enterica subsp. enterica]|nr:hypothetical protein KCP69_03415 [Salmonella enterica subsp. enterica]
MTFVQVAQANHLPLIVDAAAEVCGWVASGADMVIYSGAKPLMRQPRLYHREEAVDCRV